MYAGPERYHIDRIWKCLDHVFELPSDLDRRSKSRLILTEVMQKSEIYHNLRRLRVPKSVEDKMPSIHASPSSAGQHSGSPDISPPPATNVSPPVVTASLSNVLPGVPEYRNFPAVGVDAFYSTQQNIAASASPQSSDTGSLLSAANAGSGDMMVDVDWVSGNCPTYFP